ncbi:hypothetical protein Goarm_016308 [Gossypium armourianum]|uniref:Uncharacterized protein n=1 Tax=Gossypium armourianum TaxID=34283 RepID=A0A7J9JBW5_9ROSI|nr:hypothetical protein [Gossypium armourianum]
MPHARLRQRSRVRGVTKIVYTF